MKICYLELELQINLLIEIRIANKNLLIGIRITNKFIILN